MKEINIGDAETVLFYGDSITAQNLYTAFIETFLVTRFPQKRIQAYNLGWGGNTAADGIARFQRDAAPLKGSLFFVSFGSNDVKWVPPEDPELSTLIGSQTRLAALIKDSGARQVLLTPYPVDFKDRNRKTTHNARLTRLNEKLIALGEQLGLPVVNVFSPVNEIQERLKRDDPAFTFTPDGAHPPEPGQLLLAYQVLRRIAAPKTVGRIHIADGTLRGAESVRVEKFASGKEAIEFNLTLPFVPFYIPKEARGALALAPVQQELNSFKLNVDGWNSGSGCALVVDGNEDKAVFFTANQVAEGVDLALCDDLPWVQQARQVWELAQYRKKKHYEVWRELALEEREALTALPALRKLSEAQLEYVRSAGEAMRQAAQPRTHRVSLQPGSPLNISAAEVSPSYAYAPADFDKAYPPETAPAGVRWTLANFKDDTLHLDEHFGNPVNCVSYVRVTLEASAACRLRLLLGSDDGLSVFCNGKRVLARDVMRGCVLGDDRVSVHLEAGKNTLLFRVTQFSAGYKLALKALLFGRANVTQTIAVQV